MPRFFASRKSAAPATSAKPRAKPTGRSEGGRSNRSLGKRLFRILRLAVLAFLLSSVGATLFYGVVPPPITPLMLIRSAEQLGDGKPMRLAKDWVPMDEISPRMVEAVIAAEDQNFYRHRGFDWESIVAAFAINRQGKRKLGASTISQQTAKNLFLWPDRSWARKGLEAWFTFLMETFWTKRRLLTVYLNVIEMGDGIYGVEAASRHYFSKPASRLTRNEAAMLAAVLPNPRRWSPHRPTPYLYRRQAWILNQMGLAGGGWDKTEESRFNRFLRSLLGQILK
jgi:monofunctional biosynthetic peptidoglycan transglycosylase